MARQTDRVPEPRKIVERGDVFFFYRPRIDCEDVQSLDDVQRFYVALRPARKRPRMRLLTVGRKRLPDIGSHERSWGFVDLVTGSTQILARVLGEEHYDTKTRGERTLPPARPAGAGVYAFVRLGSGLFLAYERELPERSGAVQRGLNIVRRGSYAVAVKNPRVDAPPGGGLREEVAAEYPPQLLREFRGRRFASEDVHLLDYEGAEFVLIGAEPDAMEVEMPAAHETPACADIFRKLHLERERQPIEPLLTGQWR